MRVPGRELERLLGPVLPSDHGRQTLAEHYITTITPDSARPLRVLDLGCGSGSSIDAFRSVDPGVQWIGLDVPDSPETRTRTDARFELFDGVSIPFGAASFDLVFCKQVLEHVRHPAPLLAEVHRVLAPGGHFAGSTSHLEPYHALSMWNYTPLGFVELVREAGLRPLEIRPGIDSLTLITRRFVPRGRLVRAWDRQWAREAPLNRIIDLYGRALRLNARAVNATKLVFAGQFAFLTEKACSGARPAERGPTGVTTSEQMRASHEREA